MPLDPCSRPNLGEVRNCSNVTPCSTNVSAAVPLI